MKKGLHSVIAVIVCVALCVGYYFYLSHRSFRNEGQVTEIEQLMAKDLEAAYPTTPREVIRLYSRMLFCLYNDDYEEEQFRKIASQTRLLMDQELLTENPEEVYLHDLKAEINSYRQEKKEISSVNVASSKDVEKKTVNGAECAYVETTYYIDTSDAFQRTYQTYVLRKGQDGRWRIVGYYRTPK